MPRTAALLPFVAALALLAQAAEPLNVASALDHVPASALRVANAA